MEINFIDILLHVINVVILYIFLRWLLYKPVSKFLKAREDRVTERLANIESKEEIAEKCKTEYETMLRQAQTEAAEIVKRSTELANNHSKEILEKAEILVKENMQKAYDDIEIEKMRARDKMKQEITDMAVQIAQKVLEREVSVSDNQKIIDDFFTKVG